jgi:hypothetical protein
MNETVRRLLKQIAIQQDDEFGDYDQSLNELYYELYLEIDLQFNFYSRDLRA